MFEVGFSEMLVIAVVALLVLGPEKLPKAARFAGLWLRRARAHWYSVKAELEREIADEQTRAGLRDGVGELKQGMQALRESLRPELDDSNPGLRPPPPAVTPNDDHTTP